MEGRSSSRQLNCGFDGCFESSKCRNTILCHTNLVKLGALCAKCSVLYADKFCSVNKPDFFRFLYITVFYSLYFSSSISLVIYSFVESAFTQSGGY